MVDPCRGGGGRGGFLGRGEGAGRSGLKRLEEFLFFFGEAGRRGAGAEG